MVVRGGGVRVFPVHAAGQVHVAHELFSSALQLFVQVYGPMHQDIANCYR